MNNPISRLEDEVSNDRNHGRNKDLSMNYFPKDYESVIILLHQQSPSTIITPR